METYALALQQTAMEVTDVTAGGEEDEGGESVGVGARPRYREPRRATDSLLRARRRDVRVEAAWDAFFAGHGGGFFKDRHWLGGEHAWLRGGRWRVGELGCGAGATVVPLLEKGLVSEFVGVDVASSAVEMLKGKVRERLEELVVRNGVRMRLGVADAAAVGGVDAPPVVFDFAPTGSLLEDEDGLNVDVCFIVFVASALRPERMGDLVRNAWRWLRPGGRLVFRDYAWGDLAQRRMAPHQRLGRGLYTRQDGTLSFFFTTAGVVRLLKDAGFEVAFCEEVERKVENRAEGKVMRRLFVSAEGVKPIVVV